MKSFQNKLQKTTILESHRSTGTRNTIMFPKNKQALAQKLAQRDYNAKAIELLQKEIKATKHYIKQSGAHQSKTHTISKIQALYSKMCPSRQKLITPLTLSDDQYAAQWKNVTWQGLPFAPDAPVYTTNQGERVRSKSEVLIANALAQHKIPYLYTQNKITPGKNLIITMETQTEPLTPSIIDQMINDYLK